MENGKKGKKKQDKPKNYTLDVVLLVLATVEKLTYSSGFHFECFACSYVCVYVFMFGLFLFFV